MWENSGFSASIKLYLAEISLNFPPSNADCIIYVCFAVMLCKKVINFARCIPIDYFQFRHLYRIILYTVKKKTKRHASHLSATDLSFCGYVRIYLLSSHRNRLLSLTNVVGITWRAASFLSLSDL